MTNVGTVVRVDPDMPANRMVRIFNQQVTDDGTLNDALEAAVYVKDSQKRNQKKREIRYRQRRGYKRDE